MVEGETLFRALPAWSPKISQLANSTTCVGTDCGSSALRAAFLIASFHRKLPPFSSQEAWIKRHDLRLGELVQSGHHVCWPKAAFNVPLLVAHDRANKADSFHCRAQDEWKKKINK